MLASLLKPCHARLTARCWHKHGRLAWFGAPAQFRPSNPLQKLRRQSRVPCKSVSTSCAVTEQQQVGVDQHASQLLESRMSWRGRSIGCGELRETHIGRHVTICGWVHRHRGLGGKLFCDVRDSSGIVQVHCQNSTRPIIFSAHSCSQNQCVLSGGQRALLCCP